MKEESTGAQRGRQWEEGSGPRPWGWTELGFEAGERLGEEQVLVPEALGSHRESQAGCFPAAAVWILAPNLSPTPQDTPEP